MFKNLILDSATWLRSIGPKFLRMTKCLKPFSWKLKKQHRSATCWAQRLLANWKPYSCKLKKQQCSRRSATYWAQRVDTQVDWPNSFWDMTKCLKPFLENWRNNSVVGAALPAEHNALTLRSIGPIVSEIWQNVLNLILANWRNNSVVDAALPAEHNALTLRSIGPIVSEIWQNV